MSPSLRDVQERFRGAVFTRTDASPFTTQIIAGTVSAEKRLAIYRNNTFTNLRNALQSAYPVIRQLVGAGFFDYAATDYIYHHPSVCGDLHQFGGAFADFLEVFPAAATLRYLPDIARLEWACHSVYFADDAPPLDCRKLEEIPAARYGQLRFRLHPAGRLLHSLYPIDEIWRVNQEGYNGDQHVELRIFDNWLLVRRPFHHAEVVSLTASEWHLLNALANGAPLESAYEAALQTGVELDLGQALQSFVLDSTLIGIIPPRW